MVGGDGLCAGVLGREQLHEFPLIIRANCSVEWVPPCPGLLLKSFWKWLQRRHVLSLCRRKIYGSPWAERAVGSAGLPHLRLFLASMAPRIWDRGVPREAGRERGLRRGRCSCHPSRQVPIVPGTPGLGRESPAADPPQLGAFSSPAIFAARGFLWASLTRKLLPAAPRGDFLLGELSAGRY